ncbi:Probable adenine permease PurP [uncultured Ruminococcus sp.]|uniref:NCS2 family permease n=1 Tax=Massiliimalia timonensis TaxID=1987501 RepID=A0A8J6PBG5_9FIRM|nr:NCS2 family permease [Massiliimalia timonensis]MBC8611002.1 NCS2 family permease [Massiliimalia timonensis]SCH11388.1 Probable adenine permease PurP [uncultured Clostridium sp.]SCI49558.1 Probable adenine permease PurP [uncultured Ruminococcus sp.]
MLEKFFKLKEHGTTVRTEILAGITTFFAMVYILMVNANMFADPFGDGSMPLGVSYGAIYIATAISAVVGTLLIGLLANLPLAQASGMGLNAFFVYTVCVGFGLTYANALVLVLFDGIIFIILTATGLRKKIFTAIPQTVRVAIPAGIGLFIAFLGLQNAKIVVPSTSTGVTLGSFNLLTEGSWATIMPMLVTVIAVLAIAIMSKRNVRGAVLWGILGGAVLYYLLGFTVPDFYANLGITMSSPFEAFKAFGTEAFGKVFTEGFNFSAYADAHGTANLVLIIITTALAFCMVDMFDTLGTLYGACARGNMLTKEGEVPNMDRAMLADAIATTTGAVCGTSTVTTFVESSSGVAEGGRTGLTSISTAVLFFIAMFLSPVAQLVPSCATAAALIYVGVLMMACVKEIDWHSIDVAVPAFLTIAFMPFAYNISYGIAFGLISYVAIKLFTGKVREIKGGTWVITLLFLAMLFLTH